MKKTPPIQQLRERLAEIAHFSSILSLLNWDQEVYMPHEAAKSRATSIAQLSGLIHKKTISLDEEGTLSELKKKLNSKKLNKNDAVIASETWRMYNRARKLPENFVTDLAKTASQSQHAWAKAREENNFKSFLPWLQKIVDLKKKEAELVGYSDSPYDALLDAFDPGMTTKEAKRILEELKGFLVPFLARIRAVEKKSKLPDLKGNFPLDKQIAFNEMIARTMGFNFGSGRLDVSTHPFTSGFHPKDVRITTRYDERDILYSIGPTIHEAGHALYEQGLPHEHFGTPLAETVSLGIHESQSRLWENNIGKGKPFWQHLYPVLQKEFPKPFKKIQFESFYRALNEIRPSLVRVQADEATYNLHIIIRFEIEKDMIEGKIALKDLPQIWKSKMKEYLGVEVPNDREGVLQDVHWSAGYIGYFPSYSFGNIYAAQLYAAMEKQIPMLSKKIAKGNLSEARQWLLKNIHAHGKAFSAHELMRKATGEPLNTRYFREYLEQKYEGIYPGIKNKSAHKK